MSFHWLPFKFRMLLLNCQVLKNRAPEYISELIMLFTSARPLRSSEQGRLVVPQGLRGLCRLSWVPGCGTISSWESNQQILDTLGHSWTPIFSVSRFVFEPWTLFWVVMLLVLFIVMVMLTNPCPANFLSFCKTFCNLGFEVTFFKINSLCVCLLSWGRPPFAAGVVSVSQLDRFISPEPYPDQTWALTSTSHLCSIKPLTWT